MKHPLLISLSLLFATLVFAKPLDEPIAVGERIPDVFLRSENGEQFDLRRLLAGKPAVLIFYRGGWCPYCTRHLSALVSIETELMEAGFQLIAISPDKPAALRESPDHKALNYTLLSDSAMDAAKAFGIAFKVEDDVVAKYEEYGIDLEAASGESHKMLPHPAVFVVDEAGRIQFSHVNPNYKSRLDPAKILDAARANAAKARSTNE